MQQLHQSSISVTASNKSQKSSTASDEFVIPADNLCTRKGEKMGEYALAEMDSNLFVSMHMLALPDKETLQEFMLSELK